MKIEMMDEMMGSHERLSARKNETTQRVNITQGVSTQPDDDETWLRVVQYASIQHMH